MTWESSCPTWRAQAQRSPNTAAKCSRLWRPRRSWKATGLLARGRRRFVFQMKRRFQVLPHTLGFGPEVWRVLDKCHQIRNLGEYEGGLNIDERIVADLITA